MEKIGVMKERVTFCVADRLGDHPGGHLPEGSRVSHFKLQLQ